MFEGITKKRKNRVFNYAGWGLLILVCGIFMFTGYSPNLDFAGSGAAVAEVNGEAISYNEFSRYFERAQEDRKAGKLSPEDRIRLQKEVVDGLVNRTLILQAAKKQGIFISANEMADYLMQIPQFQENGKFSLLKYKQLIKAQNMSEARFESKIAEDLLVQKMNNLYVRSTKEDNFLKKQEDAMSAVKLNLQFISKPKGEVVSDKEISAADIEQFTKDHADKITKYYNDNKEREFTQPEQVEAQHILIKTGPEVTEDQALEKIKKIASEVNAGNFSELAKKYSEDPGSKDKGGSLGAFSKGRMEKSFEEAAFNLEPGKVSEPVKTPFGYHILKVTQKIPLKVQDQASVQNEIARKLVKEEKMASAVADIKKALNEGADSLQALVTKKGWTWDETGVFSIGDFVVPKLGDNEQVLNAGLSLGANNPIYKDVIESEGNIYLVKYKSADGAKEAPKGPLNQTELFKQLFERQQSYEMFQGWMEHLKKNASVQINTKLLSSN